MFLRKMICLILLFSMVLPLSPRAEGPVTTALGGATAALGTVNTALGTLQASQANMQNLLGQFGLLQNQQNNLNQAQQKFTIIQQQLSQAKAEADQCITNANKNLESKYKKATIIPARLASVTPNCNNYGNVLDSIAKNGDQLNALNAGMACYVNLQKKIELIGEQAKAPFAELTKAANDVWNTRKQIIETHKGIRDRVEKDVNDPDTGYRTQLNKLKELSIKIQNSLGAVNLSDSNGGQSSGIGKRIADLKVKRSEKAHEWYYNFMGKVDTCLSQATQEVRAQLSDSKSRSPTKKAQAVASARELDLAINDIGKSFMTSETLQSIDVKSPKEFLEFSDKRFRDKFSIVSNKLKAMKLPGQVNKNELVTFALARYRKCFDTEVWYFKKDLNSKVGAYSQALKGVEEEEAALNNDIKNLLGEAQESMTEFRTRFTKDYNNDLSQFTNDCTASNNPYDSAECLRKMGAILQSGIDGSTATVNLDGKPSITYKPDATTLNLQQLTIDASGRAALSNTSITCLGFNKCVDQIQKYGDHHRDQMEARTKDQDAFVVDHNKNMDSAMANISKLFGEMTGLVSQGAQAINNEMAKLGASGTVKTTSVEGKPLEKNETTKLYEVPTNMKAAFAGTSNYTEFESISDATSGINERKKELMELQAKARQMKDLCSIKKEDFSKVASRLVCDEKKICRDKNIQNVFGPLETLFRKSQSNPDPSDKGAIVSEFRSCQRDAAREARVDPTEAALTTTNENRLALRVAQKEAKEESRKDCITEALDDIKALGEKSRDATGATNEKITSAIGKIADSCPDDPEEAVSACEEAKNVLRRAEPPSGEGETILTANENENKMSNPLSTQAK